MVHRLAGEATARIRGEGQLRGGRFLSTSRDFAMRNVGFRAALESVMVLCRAIGNVGSRVITYYFVLFPEVSRTGCWVRVYISYLVWRRFPRLPCLS